MKNFKKNILTVLSLLFVFMFTSGFEHQLTFRDGNFSVRSFKVLELSDSTLEVEDELDAYINIDIIAYSDFNSDGLEDVLVTVFWREEPPSKYYDFRFHVLTKFSYDGIYITIYSNNGEGEWNSTSFSKKKYFTRVLTGKVGEENEVKLKLIIDGDKLLGGYLSKYGRPEELKVLNGSLLNNNQGDKLQFELSEKTGGVDTATIKGSFKQVLTSMNVTEIRMEGVRFDNPNSKGEPFVFSSEISGPENFDISEKKLVKNIEFIEKRYEGWASSPEKEMIKKRDAIKFENLSQKSKNKYPDKVVVDNCLDSLKFHKIDYWPMGPLIDHPVLLWQMQYSQCDLPELFRNASKPLKSYLPKWMLTKDLLARGNFFR
ncbi:MAG: hypothetical protein HOF21_15810 [Nitrospina sp.]|jgi:hypothetical protein|nr:hypothetical protein [Nitrospina sp.]MBT4556690.1 hypothetical protein [Nitrospina sp.]